MTTFSRVAAALTTSFVLASAVPAFAAEQKADKPGTTPYSCETKPGKQPKQELTPAEARAAARNAARGVAPSAPLACNDDRKPQDDAKPKSNPEVKPGNAAKVPTLKP
ncbi:MAG: hypothetical protein ACXW30_04575 [Micavibrio sp.]